MNIPNTPGTFANPFTPAPQPVAAASQNPWVFSEPTVLVDEGMLGRRYVPISQARQTIQANPWAPDYKNLDIPQTPADYAAFSALKPEEQQKWYGLANPATKKYLDQQFQDEYKKLYAAEANRLNTERQAAYAGVTPEQYAGVLNDPKYADYFKYAPMSLDNFGVNASLYRKTDPAAYTPELIQRWANQYSDVGDPLHMPKNLDAKSIEFYKQHPEYLGVGARGPLGSIANISLNLNNFGTPSAQTPAELRKYYDERLKDPSTATEIAFKKALSTQDTDYKKGESVDKYGGAHFGEMGVGPSVAYQKSVRDTPGAGLIVAGLDPNDPNIEAQAKAWIDYHKARGTGFWQEGAWGKEYGREDARMPGWATLRKQYPKASTYQLLDAMMRGQVGQSALKPRSFDFMQIIDPLVQAALTVASGGNPTLAMVYGGVKGGVEGGPLGALGGIASGYGIGSTVGGIQAAGGIGNYASNAISNFGKGIGSFVNHPIDYISNAFSSIGDDITSFAKDPITGIRNIVDPELTYINDKFTGLVGADIAARSEPILHSLEPFVGRPYAGRMVTPQSLLASEPLKNINQFYGPEIAGRAGTSSIYPMGPPSLEDLAGGANLPTVPTKSTTEKVIERLPVGSGTVSVVQPPMQVLPAPKAKPGLDKFFDEFPNLLGTEDVDVYGGPYRKNYVYFDPDAYYGAKEGGMISSHRYADGGSVMIDPMNPMANSQHGGAMYPRDMMGNLDGKSMFHNTSQGLASLGRQGDSMLVHMSPSEVQALRQLGLASGRPMTVNPATGLPEAFKLKDILPSLGGAALSLVFPDMSPLSAGLLTGAATGLITGDWEKGLYGGLGGFGGASLTQGLMGAGGVGRSAKMREPSYDEIARDTDDIAAAPRTAGERGLRTMGMDLGGAGGRLAAAGRGVKNVFSEGLAAFPKVEGAGILGSGGKGLALSSLAALAPALAADARRSDKGARPIEKNPYAAYGREIKPIPQGLHYGYDEAGNRKYVLDKDNNIVQQLFVSGGIADLARGGSAPKSGGYLDGPGDGMSDSIAATIEDKQPARLADGEFVIPADVVSGLGNGSSKAGAKKLYTMMDRVRHARTGTKKQGKQINADKYLPA